MKKETTMKDLTIALETVPALSPSGYEPIMTRPKRT
jgi:hypothetical protein